VQTARGGAWSPSGVIVFGSGGPLQQIPQGGGTPTPVTELDAAQQEFTHRSPCFLPDGRHFLFAASTVRNSGARVKIKLGSLDSRQTSVVLSDLESVVTYSSSHLLFLREGTLLAQPFDARSFAVTGEAVPIGEQVGAATADGRLGLFSVSSNGLLVYQSGSFADKLKLTWFDRNGKASGAFGEPDFFNGLSLSPDDKSVGVHLSTDPANGTREDIWIYRASSDLRTRFTFDPNDERNAIWSPDGRFIAFMSNRKGHFDLYRKASNNSGAEELLFADNSAKQADSWSPDGKTLLFESNDGNGRDLWVLPVTGDPKPARYLQTPFYERYGQFSPDGRWVVYQSDESTRSEIYVAPFPGPGGKRQISAICEQPRCNMPARCSVNMPARRCRSPAGKACCPASICGCRRHGYWSISANCRN